MYTAPVDAVVYVTAPVQSVQPVPEQHWLNSQAALGAFSWPAVLLGTVALPRCLPPLAHPPAHAVCPALPPPPAGPRPQLAPQRGQVVVRV